MARDATSNCPPQTQPRIAILGAGPIGLEAALAASSAGFPFTLFEAAQAVGGNVRRWGHIRLFTPWDLNVSPRMRRELGESTECITGAECPAGHELVDRVLEPLARLNAIRPHLELETRVAFVGRKRLLKHEEIASQERASHPFRLLLKHSNGSESIREFDVVLDCTGSYAQPNTLGDGGIPALGEEALAELVHYDIPDLDQGAGDWLGRTTLIVGAGHSAQTAVRDFARLARERPTHATRVLWALRKESPTWGAVEQDALPERAKLTSEAASLAADGCRAIEAIRGVVVEAVARVGGKMAVILKHLDDTRHEVEVDRILCLTGRVGDHMLYRQLQVHECYATSGPIKLAAALLSAQGGAQGDCLDQTSHGAESLMNPEPGFFILGSKSYGRNNTFLLRVGWDQVREVFEVLSP